MSRYPGYLAGLYMPRFLADYYRPVVSERHPDVEPIAVNLPFG